MRALVSTWLMWARLTASPIMKSVGLGGMLGVKLEGLLLHSLTDVKTPEPCAAADRGGKPMAGARELVARYTIAGAAVLTMLRPNAPAARVGASHCLKSRLEGAPRGRRLVCVLARGASVAGDAVSNEEEPSCPCRLLT